MPAPDPTQPRSSASPQGGRQISVAVVRDRLVNDLAWRTFTNDQRRWVCPWCLSAVMRRPQKSWEDSVAAHLESCRNYGHGRKPPQPPASVQAQLAYENMVGTAETDPAWGISDPGGCWICPACLERVADARLMQGQRTQLTYRAMAMHLQRCQAFARGVVHPVAAVRAAREHPAAPGSGSGQARQTATMAAPVRTPASGQPRLPAQPTVATPITGMPIMRPPSATAVPVARPIDPQRHQSSTGVPIIPTARVVPPPASQPPASLPPASQPPAPNKPPTTTFIRTRRSLRPSSAELPAMDVPPEVPVAKLIDGPPVAQPQRASPMLPPPKPAEPTPSAPEMSMPPLLDQLAAEDAEPEDAGLDWMDQADEAADKQAKVEASLERTDLIRARDLQKKMLSEAPRLPGYTFATRYEPCDHITGDFFSFIQLVDGRLGFAIGDVSGHGMQAGLVMSMAKKTLEIYGELVGDPAEVLAKVNESLVGDLAGRMFVSVTYGILSPSERTIHWARAGHNPTLVVNLHSGEINEIRPSGMVLGMKAGQTFRDCLQVESTRLRDGDVFLLYTDGVTETANAQGEEFQIERLKEVLLQHAKDGPDALLVQVMDRIRHFRGAGPVADDITLLSLVVG